MNINDVLDVLEGVEGFKEWTGKHPEAKLVHIFFMIEGENFSEYHVGYYDYAADTMTTFVVNGTQVEIKEDKEVLKKPGTFIQPIDRDKIVVDIEEVLDAAKIYQEKEYPKETPLKKVMILQHLADVGMVWNVTYLTQSMQTLNMKISSDKAEVKEGKLFNMFEKK